MYVDAKWEIPTENLVLGEVLGEGAFGIVRKGVLHTGEKRREVAVKMLRGSVFRIMSNRLLLTYIILSYAYGRSPWKCILALQWEVFLNVLEKS